jgi:hypothetical protein
MNYLSIDEVVAYAAEALSAQDSRDLAVFRTWAYQAEREIGPGLGHIREEEIAVCDKAVKKPDTLASLIEVELYDAEGRRLSYRYELGGQAQGMEVSEDAHFLFLGDALAPAVMARLKYYALPMDERCQPLLRETSLSAITAFIEFMYAKRKYASSGQFTDAGAVKMYKDMWEQARAEAQSRAKSIGMWRGKELLKRWNSLMQDHSRRAYRN